MKKYLFALIAAASLTSSQAQFFGGYADGVTNVPTGKNIPFGPALRMIYEDFTFNVAGDITGFDMYGRNNAGSSVGVYYEIRSGVSAGNPGTLLYSADVFTGAFVPLPEGGAFGSPAPGAGAYVHVPSELPVGTTLHLEAGTYWVGVVLLEQFGSLDLTSTSGLSAIGQPINNGNAFYYDSSNPALNFVSMGDLDFSLAVNTVGPTNVPEPSTLALLGLAVLTFFPRRR